MKQEMININANLLAEPTFSSFDKELEAAEIGLLRGVIDKN